MQLDSIERHAVAEPQDHATDGQYATHGSLPILVLDQMTVAQTAGAKKGAMAPKSAILFARSHCRGPPAHEDTDHAHEPEVSDSFDARTRSRMGACICTHDRRRTYEMNGSLVIEVPPQAMLPF